MQGSETHDGLEDGGFARPVNPDQTSNLPLPGGEADTVQHPLAAILLVQGVQFNHVPFLPVPWIVALNRFL
ncbi:hypothetical protein D3C71_1716450 [compost metagenome]